MKISIYEKCNGMVRVCHEGIHSKYSVNKFEVFIQMWILAKGLFSCGGHNNSTGTSPPIMTPCLAHLRGTLSMEKELKFALSATKAPNLSYQCSLLQNLMEPCV